MPKTVQRTLWFPLAGVSRRGGYRDQTRPYSAPWAVNVRGVGPLERRQRGGSRPGLAKVSATDFGTAITAVVPVTSIDSTGVRYRDLVVIADGAFRYIRGTTVTTPTTELLDDNGVAIHTEAGDTIVFDSTVSATAPGGVSDVFETVEREGKLYLADTTLKVFDPLTGIVDSVVAKAGAIPTGCPLVTMYRDRLILGGTDHVFYASRQGDPTDWNFGADIGDTGRAFAAEASGSGHIGEVITAFIPNGDRSMLVATANGLWLMRGDPAVDGSMSILNDTVGIISPGAWAQSPEGMVAFLSNDGVFFVGVEGGAPVRFSVERDPVQLRNVSAAANTITMAYDPIGRGFHLFITPDAVEGVTAAGTHWWIDVENKALWPVFMPAAMQPVAVARVQGTSGLAECVFGCRDGYLRKFSDGVATDDGAAIQSHVLIGPFRLASDDISDAMLTEIHGIMADNAGTVTWRVVAGSNPEEAADVAVAGIASALAGTTVAGVAASGDWSENRNKVARPRARGPWVVVWLSSAVAWSYEAVAVVINQLGRIR